MTNAELLENIEAVKSKYGEAQAFELLGIDKTTYYNWKKGGNPNKKKAAFILRKSIEVLHQGVGEPETPYQIKSPGNMPELMQKLIESQEEQIKLLRERQQSETRLIQVEETLKIVVGILNGLKIPGQSHTPAEAEAVEVKIRKRNAHTNESNAPEGSRKSGS